MNKEMYFDLPGGGRLHIRNVTSTAIVKSSGRVSLYNDRFGGEICINYSNERIENQDD